MGRQPILTVSSLSGLPSLIDRQDPGILNRLLAGDRAMQESRGHIHEIATGLDMVDGYFTSRREYIVTVNPRGLPA